MNFFTSASSKVIFPSFNYGGICLEIYVPGSIISPEDPMNRRGSLKIIFKVSVSNTLT